MITILTYPPGRLSWEGCKYLINRWLGRQRGPAATLRSLTTGLRLIGADFQINPPAGRVGQLDIVHVISGTAALKYAIELKRQGKIRRLVAGPNVSVFPSDHNNLLLAKEIDIILQPSFWVRDVYVQLAPVLYGKVRVWAAGVAEPVENERAGCGFKTRGVLFQKNAPHELLEVIVDVLKKKRLAFQLLNYGHFDQATYFNLLNTAGWMIYLSQTESQGLALHEAWQRNVPTLVWDRGYYDLGKGQKFTAEHISAPYLTADTGLSFSGQQDFEAKLDEFLLLQSAGRFSPRAYSQAHFTDKAAAEAYLLAIEA